jgi:ABC-type spermidine/putrescine transport system permease subunit II
MTETPTKRTNRARIRRLQRGLGRLLLALSGGSVLLFLIAPVLAVIPMSFSTSGILELFPTNPGLAQYRRFFESTEWWSALLLSVQVATATAVLGTVVGVLAALGLSRLSRRLRQVVEAVLILPRIVPTIVFAVAAYSIFLRYGLVGSVFGLVLAHSVLALPFVVVLVSSALRAVDPALAEASQSLGGGPIITFFRVVFPQIRMAVFGSALFAFNISFDEVVVTLFISGARSETLPVKIWNAIQFEVTPILPAISVLVLASTLLLLSLVLVVDRRSLSRPS